MRRISLEVLNRIDKSRGFSHLVLDEALSKNSHLTHHETALVTTIVYGTLQWRAQIDYLLEKYLAKGVGSLEGSLLNILRMGIFQIVYLDKIPPHAVVNEGVILGSALRGKRMGGLVNGVLRNFLRDLEQVGNVDGLLPDPDRQDPVKGLAVWGSLPQWMARLWIGQLGYAQALELARSLNTAPRFTIRVNTVRSTVEEVTAALEGAGALVERGNWLEEALIVRRLKNPAGHPSFREGLWTVQDEASMLVAKLVNPRPGEVVVDACSGPGGKSGHLAQLMGDEGRIISMELLPQKAQQVRDTMGRLGFKSVEVREADLTAPEVLGEGSVDRLLLDAPCSNLGTLRRHPEGKWRRSKEDVDRAAAKQLTLLTNLAPAVKPGGLLVYSVCSVTREEGEDVITSFLRETQVGSGFTIEHPRFEGCQGGMDSLVTAEGFVRTWPHTHGTDGFTAVCLRRNV